MLVTFELRLMRVNCSSFHTDFFINSYINGILYPHCFIYYTIASNQTLSQALVKKLLWILYSK